MNRAPGQTRPEMASRHFFAFPCENLLIRLCLVQLDLKGLVDHRRSVGRPLLKHSIVERDLNDWTCSVFERSESALLQSTCSFALSSLM